MANQKVWLQSILRTDSRCINTAVPTPSGERRWLSPRERQHTPNGNGRSCAAWWLQELYGIQQTSRYNHPNLRNPHLRLAEPPEKRAYWLTPHHRAGAAGQRVSFYLPSVRASWRPEGSERVLVSPPQREIPPRYCCTGSQRLSLFSPANKPLPKPKPALGTHSSQK